MVRKVNFLIWPGPILRLGMMASFGFFWAINPAFADRVVYFEALGHSEIVDGGKKLGYYNTAPGQGNSEAASTLHTKCVITVTNSGPNDQKITVNVTGTATGSQTSTTGVVTSLGTDTAATPPGTAPTYSATTGANTPVTWPVSNYTLTANSQIIATVSFVAPNYLAVAVQDARCSGNITVSDSVSTSPGFVVANGMMTTWSQGTSAYQASGTGQMRAEVRYYYTPFTIGGGRAF